MRPKLLYGASKGYEISYCLSCGFPSYFENTIYSYFMAKQMQQVQRSGRSVEETSIMKSIKSLFWDCETRAFTLTGALY